MRHANPSCRRLLMHCVLIPEDLPRLKAARINAARMAITAIVTINSISVNPCTPVPNPNDLPRLMPSSFQKKLDAAFRHFASANWIDTPPSNFNDTNRFLTSALSATFCRNESVAEAGGHPDPRKRPRWVGRGRIITAARQTAFRDRRASGSLPLSYLAPARTARSGGLGHRHELRGAPGQTQLGGGRSPRYRSRSS